MSGKKKVKIVLPVYNEEKELRANTLKVLDFVKKNLSEYVFEVQIADNASTDKTLEIAKDLARTYPEISFIHLEEKGRGRAVKKSWRESKADICCYMDVDLSTDLESFSNLIGSLTRGFDIAIGSRLLPGSKVAGRTIKREIISRIYNVIIKIFFMTRFSDAQCGFKAVTKKVINDLLPHIKNNGWFFDSELLIVGEKSGYKIYEEPVRWVDNPGSTVRVLKTATEDLKGLWRLFWSRPWRS